MSDAARRAVLETHCRELKLPTVRRQYPVLVRQAAHDGWDYEAFLLQLLEAEVLVRRAGAVARLLRPNAVVPASPTSRPWTSSTGTRCAGSSGRGSPSSPPATTSSAARMS